MNLDDLMEKGGFVSPDLIPKEVTWEGAKGGPVTFMVYLKAPSAAGYDRAARALSAAGDTTQASMASRPLLVSLMVFFDAEGKQGISYAKACELKEDLCRALYAAATEVVNTGAEAAKNSQPPTSSGSSSSSTESAAKP
jgi:hypothetical protein